MRKILIVVGALGALTASSAGASHPRIDQMERVQVIAHELERATVHLYQAAAHDRHHYGYAERRALEGLYELKRAARHFRRQVERYFREPYHTEADYRSLVRSFHHAVDVAPYLHARRHVPEDFHRAEELFGDLRVYYEGGDRYGRHHRRHGQYGHRRHYRHYRWPYRYPHGEMRIALPHLDIGWRW